MVDVLCLFFVFLVVPAHRYEMADGYRLSVLLYTDRYDLWLVGVLYRNVYWHWCVPFPFLFIFSQRPEALRFVTADCEHRRWLLRRVFS